jgi:hypothetical protein
MNEASQYLIELARRNAQVYIAHPNAKAAMVTGSSAEGKSDFYSDIDMMIYYDALPSDEELVAAREQNDGSERLWEIGDRAEGAFIESYKREGVECQIVHTTITAWENQMAVVLKELDVTSPLQKALSGTLSGVPLYGEALIAQWKAQAANYPDALREKMVAHYLQFFPIWGMQDRFFIRDATLWFHQIRVEGAQNLLGVLAGLNRLYYSTFQFKRMRAFIAQMTIAPPHLSERLEALLAAEPRPAAALLEALVRETVALVEREMPQVDTSAARKRIDYHQQAWQIE